MSEQIPERADIRQLRTQAKELLRSLQTGETLVDGEKLANAKLADAQRLIARKYGFESWPKLVDKIETPILIEKFKSAVESGNVSELETLLTKNSSLRKQLNEPLFAFDTPAIVQACRRADSAQLIRTLVRFGADPNGRSEWWAGGFDALDLASEKVVDVLVELGAKFTAFSAAAQGKADVLQAILKQDPASANAPGGDGQRPLHVASTLETAKLLLEAGADLEQRDVDHESTPIQYQINRPEIARLLLEHGATPDIFTAVVLDDRDLVRQILAETPEAALAHVGAPPFVTTSSNGGHIYAYLLGSTKSPLHIAAERKKTAALEELQKVASPSQQLIAAAWAEDPQSFAKILKQHPGLGTNMGHEARAITDAAQAGKTETVRLLLEAGLDPLTPGMDSGTALHLACWFGHINVVRLLIGRVPLDLTDANHKSPPLGWTCHGSHWCRNQAGDYVGIVELLISAGADVHAPANLNNISMLQIAGNRDDVKAALRKHGAK